MRHTSRWQITLLAFTLLLGIAGQASAQQQTGNLYGTVSDSQGGALPGVSVELTGLGAPRQAFTDADGQFRFLGLDPGNYQMTAGLDGFSSVEYPAINVRVGRNTSVEVELSAAIEETIVVTAESPLLDERKVSKGTTISQIELERIPTARDPWAIVTQTPGVLSDRINVGGNESGQQSVFTTPGTSDDENAFSVDGVNITDMTAVGSSPTYYDFDQFAEIQTSTGGSDITKTNAGTSLNLVTKRGSNTPRGSARFLLTDSDEQFGIFEQGSVDIRDDQLPEQTGTFPGNTVDEVLDYGFEVGGPIVKDKVWFWGSYGRNDIMNLTSTGEADNTLLENTAFKLNAQVASPNSLVASWNRGAKIKNGRQSNPFTTGNAAWNQDGPTEVTKIEDTHVFNSNFYLTGLYSYVDGGFELQSIGGSFPSDSAPQPVLSPTGFWVNSFYSGASDRNTDQFGVDGNYFFNTGEVNHELKFGTNYRKFDSLSFFGNPGPGNVQTRTCEALNQCGSNLPGGDDQVRAYRSGNAPTELEYLSFYAQDTLSKGSWTLNAGLRFDSQEGTNLAGGAAANPFFSDVLPALDFAGNDGGFTWETVSPRIAYTYALGAERKTLLRASYARFAEQLQTTNISRLNPVGNAFGIFGFTDANGNDQYDQGESAVLQNNINFDPENPTRLVDPDRNDPGLDPSLTDELVASIEHAFLPEFVVSLEATYRLTTDILETRTFIDDNGVVRPQEASDFVPNVFDDSRSNAIPGTNIISDVIPGTNTPYTATFFRLRDGLTRPGGSLLVNGDSETEYFGVSLTATKRLANRWMLRGFVNFGEANVSVGEESRRFDDPNLSGLGGNGLGSDIEDALFIVQSAGSGAFADVLIQSSWSANVNGLYQVAPDKPWGFNVSANLFAREGYPLPYTYTVTTDDGVGRTVLASVSEELDAFRADDIFTTDLRIEKDIPFSSNLSGTLSLDAFNVFNDNFVLQRDRSLQAQTANFLTQSLSPRIFRLGFRLSFR